MLAKDKTEGTALAFRAFKDKRAALYDDNFFGHEQAQAGAVGAGFASIAGPVELRKQMGLLTPRHPDTIILNAQFDGCGGLDQFDADLSAGRRVVDGVIDEVHYYLADFGLVKHNLREFFGFFVRQGQ